MSDADLIQKIEKWCETKIDWMPTKKSPQLFHAQIDHKDVFLRLNDFPDEPICSVLIGKDEFEMEEIPERWNLPD